jgi:hypothetical protein
MTEILSGIVGRRRFRSLVEALQRSGARVTWSRRFLSSRR